MNPLDALDDEEQFALLLARYGDALARGQDVDPSMDQSLSPPMRQRLRRSLDVLRRLIHWHPRPEEQPTILHNGAPVTFRPLATNPMFSDDRAGWQVGRFPIRRELGRGGGGIVFLAFDPTLGREVALKMPKLDVLLTPALRRRFLREARTAARLNHPNLVPIFESGETGGVCYIVSAYCPGGDLAGWLQRHTEPIAPRTAAALVARLADAVQYVHEHGIWHRDIKPSNVLLDPIETRTEGVTSAAIEELSFIPRLADFGLAKLREGDGGTRSGSPLGTPRYMAPEQVEGRLRQIGPSTDVYGLGAVLYELLTRRPPFQGSTDTETLRQVLQEEPTSPRRGRADVPRELETICLKCLHKEPLKRYASAGELADDLRRFLTGQPIRGRPAGAAERVAHWMRRRSALAALLALASAFILGCLWIGLWYAARLHEQDAQLKAAAQREREQLARAEEYQRLARQHAYALCLRSAQQAWENGEIEVAGELLRQYRHSVGGADEWCGFEWRHLWQLIHSPPPSASAERRSLIVRQSHPPEAWAVAYAPDGSMLASAGDDSTIQVRDPATGQIRSTLTGHRSLVGCVTFSPDGKLLASGGYDRTVRLWEARDGTLRATLEGHTNFVRAVAFAPDGRTLASGGRDRTIKLWDARTHRPLLSMVGHTDQVRALAFSPEGGLLASASEDGTIKLWDPAAGTLRATFRDTGPIWSLVFDPRGEALASGNKAGGVVLWDLASGRPRAVLRGHSRGVRALAFSPDGRTLASGGENNTIKLWHVPTGAEVLTLKGHGDAINDLTFAPDGHMLASAGQEGAVMIWHAPRGDETEIHPGIAPAHGRYSLPARRRAGRILALSRRRTRSHFDEEDPESSPFGAST